MKTLILSALFSLATMAPAFADPLETVEAVDDNRVAADSIDAIHQIPAAGAILGKVISTYAGSAYALENYLVVVGNSDAPCEGDDCWAFESFEIRGNFNGAAKAVYSRKIDKNTYSIAILTTCVEDDNGGAKYTDGKILLRVTFTPEGVSKVAQIQFVKTKK